MFNKKVFLLLCSFGASMVPATVLAMDNIYLSEAYQALVRAMNPLFEARACTPETLDNLSLAVVLVESVLGPHVSASVLLEDGSVDLHLTIHGAIAERRYLRIVIFYKLMLEYGIRNAWGMMTPADIDLLHAECEKANAEIVRQCPKHTPAF